MMINRFILIGFMGAGKTYFGKRLSYLLNLPLVDTDIDIERHEGIKIPEIFQLQGEEYFRQLEYGTLLHFINRNNLVISCGGGLTENPMNRTLIKNSQSIVIFLDPEWTIIRERIIHTERPLVKSNSEEELYQLWLKRLPNYEECATLKLHQQDTIDKTLNQLINSRDISVLFNLLSHK